MVAAKRQDISHSNANENREYSYAEEPRVKMVRIRGERRRGNRMAIAQGTCHLSSS